MLQLRDTRFVRTRHAPVEAGVLIPEEGIPLSYVKGADGTTVVHPAVDGEPFAGVSYERNAPPAAYPFIAEYVVPAGLTLQLPRTPIAGQLLVKVAGTAVTIGATAPADAAHVQLVGDELTFFAGEDGKDLYVQMLYTPTVEEARTFVGDLPIGGHTQVATGNIGRILDGQFGTSIYDASKDWTAVIYAKVVNGVFVPGTANDHIPNVIVLNSPNVDNAFLDLSLNVA